MDRWMNEWMDAWLSGMDRKEYLCEIKKNKTAEMVRVLWTFEPTFFSFFIDEIFMYEY